VSGLDRDRLAELHKELADQVERGAVPGLIALVARHDDVHVEVLGTKTFGDSDPMPRDAIFRIASLSKPVTAAATMMLVDDGVLRLHDPVDELLPERRALRRHTPRTSGWRAAGRCRSCISPGKVGLTTLGRRCSGC
jgi:CubicO group peptidase (beta-lactamase class C family)